MISTDAVGVLEIGHGGRVVGVRVKLRVGCRCRTWRFEGGRDGRIIAASAASAATRQPPATQRNPDTASYFLPHSVPNIQARSEWH